jgi:hypothetical protein
LMENLSRTTCTTCLEWNCEELVPSPRLMMVHVKEWGRIGKELKNSAQNVGSFYL